jgi:putative membrane protein
MHLTTSLATFDSFLAYFGTALGVTAAFIVVYIRLTPHREFLLIRSGNTAAATSFIGALIGFVLPLASAIVNSVSLPDMLVWGIVALVVQVVALLAARLASPSLFREIERGHLASGILLGGLSVAFGILNAACMTY